MLMAGPDGELPNEMLLIVVNIVHIYLGLHHAVDYIS